MIDCGIFLRPSTAKTAVNRLVNCQWYSCTHSQPHLLYQFYLVLRQIFRPWDLPCTHDYLTTPAPREKWKTILYEAAV
jgi:hypothetical protein